MIITTTACARAGMVGNPSDGYFGKTISFIVRNFSAKVSLWESPHFEILPTYGDLARFEFSLRDDFAVHLDQHLLDDFRTKRNRRGQCRQTRGDNRLLHSNSLNINILLDV